MLEALTLQQASPPRAIEVAFLHKGRTAGFFSVFQSARLRMQMGKSILDSGPYLQFAAVQKVRRLPAELARDVTAPVDALLRMPSDHEWQAEPYHAALVEKFPQAIDLTQRLSRSGSHRSNLGAGLSEIRNQYGYEAKGDESAFRSLLIVDDTLRTGNSVATLIDTLSQHGLRPDCRIILACPLWIADEVKEVQSASQQNDSLDEPS